MLSAVRAEQEYRDRTQVDRCVGMNTGGEAGPEKSDDWLKYRLGVRRAKLKAFPQVSTQSQ